MNYSSSSLRDKAFGLNLKVLRGNGTMVVWYHAWLLLLHVALKIRKDTFNGNVFPAISRRLRVSSSAEGREGHTGGDPLANGGRSDQMTRTRA